MNTMLKTYKITGITTKQGRIKPDDEELNNASIYITDTKVYEEPPFSSLVNTPEELVQLVRDFAVLQEIFEDNINNAAAEQDQLTFGGKKKSKSNQKKKSKRKQKTKHRRKSTRKSRRKSH